jgi:hypothetical protein
MKRLLILFLSFLIITWVTYWVYLYNGSWQIVLWPTITSTSIWFTPKNYDKFSTEYTTQNKRQYFEEWDFVSEVYGIFSPDWRIDLIRSGWVNSNCSWESVSYYFVWNFKNKDTSNSGIDSWWKWYRTEIDPALNYYCPDSWKFSVKLASRDVETFFETIVISNWITPTYFTIQVLDSSWNTVQLDERVLFSNSKLQVWWLISTNSNINNEFLWWTENQKNIDQLININYGWKNWVWTATQFITNIKKNIITQTNGMIWSTNEITRTNLEKYMLYDFEWTQRSTASNVNNRWKIVTLNNSLNWLRVNWENTLIIKWWNLYIRDDIYNVNSTDILTIVVLRDETNKTNGGNVYIDPYVTNIDAIIISEGSVLSYNWTQVIDSTTNTNSLRKQLFIYWSIITRNTIWENKSIFNTDDYISSWWETTTTKYNLENLRSFQLVKTDQITSWPCMQVNRITAMWNTETTSINYAFAWKKECYFDWVTNWKLRSTHRVASTVIEYNPSIQLNAPSIIKIY